MPSSRLAGAWGGTNVVKASSSVLECALQMVNILEVTGIALQTATGLVLIVEQASHLDKTRILSHIASWFARIIGRLSEGPRKPQTSVTLFVFLLYALGAALAILLTNEPSTVSEETYSWVGGLIFAAVISYGIYTVAVTSVLDVILRSQRRLVFRSYPDMRRRIDFARLTQVKYVWDVGRQSDLYKSKFTRANMVVCAISLAMTGLAMSSMLLPSLAKPTVVRTLAEGVVVMAYVAFVPAFLMSFLYLTLMFISRCARYLFPIRWVFISGRLAFWRDTINKAMFP